MHPFIKLLVFKILFKDNNLHAVTIAPYNPTLNAAEMVIQAIKAKVAKRRGEGM